MKNLPCYIFLATFASLVLLVTVASLGVALPVIEIAAHIIGYAAAAGVVATFLTDGPAQRPYYADEAVATKTETAPVVPAAARQRPTVNRPERRSAGTVTRAMATLGMGHEPATLSTR